MLQGRPSRARLSLVATFAAALFSALHAQDAAQLAPAAAIDREIATGQSHVYHATLAPGDFLHITVQQKGIDVSVALAGPDGREILAVDASRDDFPPETIADVASVGGTYTITVRPVAIADPRGRYELHVEDLRPAQPLDTVRLEAERAFHRGRAHVTGAAARYREAADEYRKALEGYRQAGDRRGELKAQLLLAAAEAELRVPEARASVRRGEELARELHDQAAVGGAALTRGRVHELAGDLPGALRAYEESAVISRALGNRTGEAGALMNVAITYGRTGDSERAVVAFEQVLRLARPGEFEYNGTLNNLGVAYKNLGQYEKALTFYERALAIVRERGDRVIEPIVLNNMGNVERLQGNPRKALERHTAALAISRETSDSTTEARSLNTIGSTYYDLGEYAKALAYHHDALAIRRKTSDLPGQAASLDGAGRASHRLGDRKQALEDLGEALTIRRNLREALGESDTLRSLAAVERDAGDLGAALRHAEAAVDLDETVRSRITSPELRASYAAAEQNKYGLVIDILQQLDRLTPTEGRRALALETSERARARVLLESLLDARVDLREGIDPALLERDRSLQKQLSDTSTQLSRLLARAGAAQQSSDAAARLESLTGEYQQLQARIRQQSPRYAAVMQPRPLTAGEIQQSVVDEDTVLLEFALGEERSWVWAVTRQIVTSAELPPRREIEAATRALYELFTARQKRRDESTAAYGDRVKRADARVGTQAAVVSRMLLGGIPQLKDEWRSKRLAIVAGGALEYVPFAALPEPGSPTSTPLMARHEIVMLPSASVLAVLRREAANRSRAARTLAIVADPVFDAADPRVTARQARAPAADRDESSTRGIDLVDSLYGRGDLARLPFSREEAIGIAALAESADVFTALDFTASRETVLGGALGGHRIVHLATHGVVDSQVPARSSLVLSLVDERGARRNGYLRLHDIYNMRLDADLVVLSGCQTALGKEIKGEGLIGLTRAFIYAGAPRVVASLWQVSDLATAELMKAFYRGMLQQRLPPAAALRAAQLQLSRDARWAPPYFWAGFVLQGEYR